MGPDSVFPIRLKSRVSPGFGRGSTELGCPTANVAPSEVARLAHLENGVYYGVASVSQAESSAVPNLPRGAKRETPPHNFGANIGEDAGKVYPMVMSIGWNPYYKNEEKSIEVHIIHKYANNFYGAHLWVEIRGFLRPQRSFSSLEELKSAIQSDIEEAQTALGSTSPC